MKTKKGPTASRVALRLSCSLHKRAVLLAQRDNVSLNSWLVEAIALYMGSREVAQQVIETGSVTVTASTRSQIVMVDGVVR